MTSTDIPVSPQKVVLSRMVRGSNATMLLACVVSLFLSSLISYVGCRSLPLCGCYDGITGLVRRQPQHSPVSKRNLETFPPLNHVPPCFVGDPGPSE